MSADAGRRCVSVKCSPAGRTQTFLLPHLAFDAPRASGEGGGLAPGDQVVVATAEGPVLGTVTRAVPERKRPPADSPARVLRRATSDDVVARLQQQEREREAYRGCLRRIRERGGCADEGGCGTCSNPTGPAGRCGSCGTCGSR